MMNNMLINNTGKGCLTSSGLQDSRIQDLVARTAHISLRQTVKILRVLPVVLRAIGDEKAAEMIEAHLLRGAVNGGYASPLHSRPQSAEVENCYVIHEQIENLFGEQYLEAILDLTSDPYFEEQVKGFHIN